MVSSCDLLGWPYSLNLWNPQGLYHKQQFFDIYELGMFQSNPVCITWSSSIQSSWDILLLSPILTTGRAIMVAVGASWSEAKLVCISSSVNVRLGYVVDSLTWPPVCYKISDQSPPCQRVHFQKSCKLNMFPRPQMALNISGSMKKFFA